jgi:hypothetical protein
VFLFAPKKRKEKEAFLFLVFLLAFYPRRPFEGSFMPSLRSTNKKKIKCMVVMKRAMMIHTYIHTCIGIGIGIGIGSRGIGLVIKI